MKPKLLATFRRGEDRGTLRCPFCKDSIYPAPTVIRCSFCRTVHHEKCWQDNMRCSVFGCSGKPQQEHTEYYLIEAFQKRRKKLIRSWYVSIISVVVIVIVMSYMLQILMPIEGRVLFSGAVAFFVLAIIVLNGYAQYLCPVCGHQPRINIIRKKKYSFPLFLAFDTTDSHLLLNPTNCPSCKVRLR